MSPDRVIATSLARDGSASGKAHECGGSHTYPFYT